MKLNIVLANENGEERVTFPELCSREQMSLFQFLTEDGAFHGLNNNNKDGVII